MESVYGHTVVVIAVGGGGVLAGATDVGVVELVE